MRTKDVAHHQAHEKGRHMSAPNDPSTTKTLPPEQPPTPPGQQPPSSPETAPPLTAPAQPAQPATPGAPRQRSLLSFVQGFLTALLLLGLIAVALYYLGLGQSILPEAIATATTTATATTPASTPTVAPTATPTERIIYQDSL